MGAIDDGLGECQLESGQAHVEAGLQEEAVVAIAQADFGIDRDVGRQADAAFLCRAPCEPGCVSVIASRPSLLCDWPLRPPVV
jgi:hypothetical protein